jgi:cysteine desulfurase
MLPYLKNEFGNAGSIHAKGQSAKNALEKARRGIAKILWCEPEEIIFTSGGTESDNLALRGILEQGDHLIISNVEHHAILHPADELEKSGVAVTKIPVGKNGIVDAQKVIAAIRPETKLISIMLANNEIGTLQPVRDIGKMLQKKREKGKPAPWLHTDAVQGGGILNLDTRHLKVDLLSLSAHKFYGPKGLGILFKKKGVKLNPLLTGGSQERGLRAGTENIAGIVGMATALELAENLREKEFIRLTKLRDYFVKKVLAEIPKSRLNGDAEDRLPGNANFSFFGIEGESILLRLDFEGICASSGSACTSGSLDPSHVLQALKIPHEWLHGSIRFTLGKSTTKKDLDFAVGKLKKIVQDLRKISPLV